MAPFAPAGDLFGTVVRSLEVGDKLLAETDDLPESAQYRPERLRGLVKSREHVLETVDSLHCGVIKPLRQLDGLSKLEDSRLGFGKHPLEVGVLGFELHERTADVVVAGHVGGSGALDRAVGMGRRVDHDVIHVDIVSVTKGFVSYNRGRLRRYATRKRTFVLKSSLDAVAKGCALVTGVLLIMPDGCL